MRYSIEPKDRIYVKEYGFLSFAKSMGKNNMDFYPLLKAWVKI